MTVANSGRRRNILLIANGGGAGSVCRQPAIGDIAILSTTLSGAPLRWPTATLRVL